MVSDNPTAGSIEYVPGANGYLLLFCEHAGDAVPAEWRNLGLDHAYFATHFAVDIGAAELTRALAERLDAPAVLARYSRLFYDINREPCTRDSARQDMGGIPVPGNERVTQADLRNRDRLVRKPFDETALSLARGRKAAIAIHSFSPVFDGQRRETEIGILRSDNKRLSQFLLARLREDDCYRIGDNLPYDMRTAPPGTLTRLQTRTGVETLAIEVRNDLLASPDATTRMGEYLAASIEAAIEACST